MEDCSPGVHNRKDPNCYRRLCTIPTFEKIFVKILDIKLTKIKVDLPLVDLVRTDNLFILQQLIEKSIAVESEVHLAFVGLDKVYPIPRFKLWNALQLAGYHLLGIIIDLYRNNTSYIKIGHFRANSSKQGTKTNVLFSLNLR